MAHDRYDLQWVGRCRYDEYDKIWAWFFYQDPLAKLSNDKYQVRPAYVFWAKTGKTPSFKKHSYSSYNMIQLVKSKIDRKYIQISVEDTIDLWPTIYKDLDDRFIFHLLAENL